MPGSNAATTGCEPITTRSADQARYALDTAAAKLRRDENLREAAKIIKADREADISYLLEETAESEPTLQRYIANDTTAEALGVLLQQNPNGLLVFRDELVSLLESLDQEEHVTQRGLYLTGWNGNSPYTFDRITRGLHLSIDAVCLSILGTSQPGRISQYLSRAIRGGRLGVREAGELATPDSEDVASPILYSRQASHQAARRRRTVASTSGCESYWPKPFRSRP
jgi:hypothetical protein